MAFEGFQDSIKEYLESIKVRIIESEAGSRLMESYYNLTASQQRLVVLLGLAVFLFILMSLPIKPFISSQEELSSYKERQELIQKLQSADSLKNSASFSLKSFGLFQLKGHLESKLKSLGYESERIKISASPVSQFEASSKVVTKSFDLDLKNSNVRQLSKVLRLVENIDDSLIVTQLKTKATLKDPHLFDTEIKITHLSLPSDESQDLDASSSGFEKGRPSFEKNSSLLKKDPYDFRNRKKDRKIHE